MSPASTHTEVYRPFTGELDTRTPPCITLASVGIRAALRRKLPLVLLYGPPAIATIAFSFAVYVRYSALDEIPDSGFRAGVARTMADRLLAVREMIVQLNIQIRMFSTLAIAWYGAGLLSDDRVSGAHQLWFARPMTRLQYFLGKFLTAAFFGMLAVTLPIVVICATAAFNSPDWVFLKEDWPLVLKSLGFSTLWVVTLSSIVLACSSLADRKIFALAAMFAFLMISMPASGIVAGVYDDMERLMISPIFAFQALGEDWLGSNQGEFMEFADTGLVSVLAVTVLSLLICAWRLRKAEVVA